MIWYILLGKKSFVEYMETDLNRLYEQFKKLPDYGRYPMPDVYYKHFNETKPKPAELQETLDAPNKSVLMQYKSFEDRGPLPGGVREVPELPPLELKTEIKTDDEIRIEQMQQTMSTINVDHYQEIKKLWRGIALTDERTKDQIDRELVRDIMSNLHVSALKDESDPSRPQEKHQ